MSVALFTLRVTQRAFKIFHWRLLFVAKSHCPVELIPLAVARLAVTSCFASPSSSAVCRFVAALILSTKIKLVTLTSRGKLSLVSRAKSKSLKV